MENKQQLAKEIREFLAKYAGRVPDRPDEYTSPDAYQLEMAATLLEQNKNVQYINSSWQSGGYKPYTSEEGRKLHDSLINRCKKLNLKANVKSSFVCNSENNFGMLGSFAVTQVNSNSYYTVFISGEYTIKICQHESIDQAKFMAEEFNKFSSQM